MLCINRGPGPATFRIDGQPGESRRYVVPEGGTVEIADGYCKPYLSPSRRPMKPLVTQLHRNMEPLPGQYAPGMSPELHELKGVPGPAQAQIDNLAAQVAALTAQLQRLAGPAPAVVPPPVELTEDLGEDVVVDDEPSGDFDAGDVEIAALVKQSKAELLSLAREMGARAEEKMTKAQLAEAILDKRTEPEDE